MRLAVQWAFLAVWLTGAFAQDARSPEFFETKIRPVLAAQCYACHSKTAVAGLRVDSREALLKGGQIGPSIVPGEAAKSLLIQALKHEHAEVKMPKGGKLKTAEIQAFVDWVNAGAPWPAAKATTPVKAGALTPEQRNWWSFRPLHLPAAPAVKSNWARTEIDKFVWARLETEGLKPVRLADKRTLIRRAALDLTGLPPTPEEVDAFVKDTAPDAFAKVVDRLLASPAYGERWARHWLDVVRFGEDDTRGLAPMGRGHEPYQYAYLFRDWVVQAMNDDLPYDQFVKAHLAADLLPDADRVRMLPALGFLGQGPWYYDLTEPAVARADERHERVDTTTRAFLGLTVGCARCHDHKYDPVSMTDYYGLAGIFNATNYHEYPLVPKKVSAAWEAEDKKIKDLEKMTAEFQRTAAEQLSMVLARQMAKYMVAVWKVHGEPQTPVDQVLNQERLDRELFDRYVRFLAKPPSFYPFLKDWQAMMKSGGTEDEAKRLAEAFQKLVFEVVAEKADLKKKNERLMAKNLEAGDDEVKSIPLPNGFKSFFDQHQLELKSLDRERMNLWTDVFQRDVDDEPETLGRRYRPGLLSFNGFGLERQLSAEHRDYLTSLREEIERRRKELGPQFPFVHGVADVEKPVDLEIHRRGSPYQLGDQVPRSFPLVLTQSEERQAFTKGSGRLDLAARIAEHPLAARVMVNRVWRAHFGTGLVETPSNFGAGGERPSHPELLEYLAAKFVAEGRSLKKLHRDIMLSSVYQLASDSDSANQAKDPGNRLYWRANKNRMDAEQIRDSMLTLSGKLERKMYGPSAELNDSFNRRTIYGRVSRFRLDTYLALFDFPNPNITAEKRYVTNVPLQRLFFLNSDFVYLQARAMVKKLADLPNDEARIRKLYQTLYYREATADEVRAGIEYLTAEKAVPPQPEPESKAAPVPTEGSGTNWTAADGKDEPKAAAKAPAGPDPKPAARKKKDEKPSAQKPDPWTQYVRVLLSSSEFTYIE
jgi:hypothetical protein